MVKSVNVYSETNLQEACKRIWKIKNVHTKYSFNQNRVIKQTEEKKYHLMHVQYIVQIQMQVYYCNKLPHHHDFKHNSNEKS